MDLLETQQPRENAISLKRIKFFLCYSCFVYKRSVNVVFGSASLHFFTLSGFSARGADIL